MVERTNVTQMLPGNNQSVPGVKLPKVNKCHGQIVFPDNTGRLGAAHDPAEEASITHELSQQI